MIIVFVPVYNEERILEENIMRLKRFLDDNIKGRYKLIIADGRSTDETPRIGKKLEKRYKTIAYFRTNEIGKGAQLKKAALSAKGDYFAFLDADIPIKFREFKEIVDSISRNEADLVIASRHAAKKKIDRPLIRKIASKMYSFAIRLVLKLPVSDTIAGCKAWNRKIQRDIWPKLEDKKFFFDTELVYFAFKKGYRVKEIPVSYKEGRGSSSLNVLKDGLSIARNLIKLPFRT